MDEDMKVFPTRIDMIMLDVRKEQDAHPSSYWADRCREVPDALIARYEALFQELDDLSDQIEQAYGNEGMRT